MGKETKCSLKSTPTDSSDPAGDQTRMCLQWEEAKGITQTLPIVVVQCRCLGILRRTQKRVFNKNTENSHGTIEMLFFC